MAGRVSFGARVGYHAAMRVCLLVSLVLALCWPLAVRADPPAHEDLRTLDEHLARSPYDVDALALRAELRIRDGQIERALDDARLIAALAPEDPRATLVRAQAVAALGRDAEALDLLDAFVATRPGTRAIHAQRAELLVRLERPRDALDACEAALALGDDVDLHLLRARLYEQLGQTAQAARALEEGLVATGAAPLRSEAIALARRSGDHARALALIEEARALAPRAARWAWMRGDALADAGRLDEARAAWSEALALADRAIGRRPSAAARVDRGEALLRLGRVSEARESARAALAMVPNMRGALDLARRAEGGAR